MGWRLVTESTNEGLQRLATTRGDHLASYSDSQKNTSCAVKCLHCPEPQYKSEARKRQVQGIVVLNVVVDEKGTAKSVTVTRSLALWSNTCVSRSS
jgi:outer membrane biosynthesis protein TonB